MKIFCTEQEIKWISKVVGCNLTIGKHKIMDMVVNMLKGNAMKIKQICISKS